VKQQSVSSTRTLLLSVYAPTLLLTFSQGILVPTLPLYAQSFGLSFSLVSVVVAAASLGTLFADVPVGMALERLGRKRLMVLGTCLQAVSGFLLAVSIVFPELVLCRLLAGIAAAMWNISRMAYITDVIPVADRGKALSTFGGISRIGTFVGPAIGGIVGASFGLNASLYVSASLTVVAAVLSFLLVAESKSGPSLNRNMRWRVVGGLTHTHGRDLVTAGSAQVFGQMIRAGRQIIIPLYAASVLNLDIGAIGAVVSISAAVDMSLFLPAGYIMDRFGRKWASVPCFFIMGIGMALVPLANDYYTLLLATIVMAIGNGLGSGTMMTLGADLAPREATGEFLGLWRLIGDIGATGGPLVVGGIADFVGLGVSALALSGVGFLAAATLALFVRETLAQSPVLGKSKV
jgi:MFS family permease